MKILNNLIILFLALATIAVGVLFSVQNTAQVPLDLLIIELPERSLALWVLLAFAVGGLLGMLTNMGVVWRLRASLAAARRKLERQQKPVES